jgi:hypothetical protein
VESTIFLTITNKNAASKTENNRYPNILSRNLGLCKLFFLNTIIKVGKIAVKGVLVLPNSILSLDSLPKNNFSSVIHEVVFLSQELRNFSWSFVELLH